MWHSLFIQQLWYFHSVIHSWISSTRRFKQPVILTQLNQIFFYDVVTTPDRGMIGRGWGFSFFLMQPLEDLSARGTNSTYNEERYHASSHRSAGFSLRHTYTKTGQTVPQNETVTAHKEPSAPFSPVNCGFVRYEMKPPPRSHQYSAIMNNREIAHATRQSILLSLATSRMQSEAQQGMLTGS